jgi:CRP-like cAMP-binding protein
MPIEPTLNTVERTLLLLELEPFQALGSDELALLAARMTELRFAAGETIVTDADVEGRLYVVVEGVVEMERGGIPMRQVTKAMAFGILGLMGVIAYETARAVAPTHVLVLAREDFIEALSDNPAFAVGCLRGLALLVQSMAQRIEDLEKSLRGR